MDERYYIEESIDHSGNCNIIDRTTGKMVAMAIAGKEKAQEIAMTMNEKAEYGSKYLASHLEAAGISETKEFYWVRSTSPEGRDLVKMIFKGRHRTNNDEGWIGDVKCRPTELGDGEYTVTVGFQDCETLDGKQFTQNWPKF